MIMTAKKVWKITSNLITGLLFLLLIFMIFVVVSSKLSGGEPNFLGYQLKTVLSGSMEPTFKTGSVIVVKPLENPEKLKKDDVITFMVAQDQLATHRIVEVFKNDNQVMYKTKGDNNNASDKDMVLSQNVVAKYTGITFPYLGYFMDFTKSKIGLAILFIIPGLLLLVYSGFTIVKAIIENERTQQSKDIQESVHS
jgi:signal peptidase I